MWAWFVDLTTRLGRFGIFPLGVQRCHSHPARYMRTIRGPFRSTRVCEPRLLAEDHPEMKGDGDEYCVDPQRTRRERSSPAAQDDQHRDIHRIPRQPIQADNDEALRRRPGREAATPGDVEVTNAPQEQANAGDEKRDARYIDASPSRPKQPWHEKSD